MCKPWGLKKEQDTGTVFVLCDESVEHLAELLGFARQGSPDERLPNWAADLHPFENDPFAGPIDAVLSAFDAKTVVVEWDYYDLDFRSEFTATNETTFAIQYPLAHRIHFFYGSPPARRPHLYDVVSRLAPTYLGYMTIRPTEPSSVGRTLISPERCRNTDLKATEDLADHVRTAMTEYVELFGVSLTAVGVPFMEQDGRLLRCAHVTAWAAHYTAVLRGLVARRPSAAFHIAEDSNSYGRTYPSSGLNTVTQSVIMSKLGMPPEVIYGDSLLSPPVKRWHSRPELFDADRDTLQDLRVTLTESLTSTACRYLNSGMPVILDRADINHSQLICGYIREDDLARPRRTRVRGESDVVGFLVHDDQLGPYRLLDISQLIDRALEDVDPIRGVILEDIPFALVVPAPRGLWLSGTVAELVGGDYLSAAVRNRFHRITKGRLIPTRRGRPDLELMERLQHSVMAAEPDGNFGLRSYALSATDFKEDFIRRLGGDRVAARVVGTTRMPKYVWVVEVLDRDARRLHNPAVVGTVVLDGSAVSEHTARPDALLIHIPGEISAIDAYGDVWDSERWRRPIRRLRYFSGRWNHKHSSYMTPEKVAARHKGAASQ